ncbi:MAG: methyltransferase domain-containing protein [Candidatus Omnitrophica bacterium]|nr:methyltransferase domain-containing protein [Candidatus Omnitrophota bacterium]
MGQKELNHERLIGILACPVCKGKMHARGSSFNCNNCGIVFSQGNQRFLDFFPKEALIKSGEYKKWHQRQDLFLKWLHNVWSRDLAAESYAIYDEFEESIKDMPCSLTLDIGCGDGHLRSRLKGAEYIGIDPFEGWILEERPGFMGEFFPVKDDSFIFIKGLGEYLPFREGVFDSVFITNALDHGSHPLRILEEAGRVLKPGGRLNIIHENPSLTRKIMRNHLKGNLKMFARKIRSLFLLRDFGVVHKAVTLDELNHWLDKRFTKNSRLSSKKTHIFYYCLKK